MFDFVPVSDNTKIPTYDREVFLLEHIGQESFLTTFDINKDNTISNPIAVDPKTLINKLKKPTKGGIGLIDPRLLYQEGETMVWMYQPSKNQPFYYRRDKKVMSKPIFWNHFIFKKVGNRLSICVAPNGKRPTLSTPVYHAPLPNVYESSCICLGSCTLPNTTDIDAISEAYFNSTKTHLNFHGALRQYKSCNQSQYQKWITTKTKEKIRISELNRFGTLKDFI